MTAPTNLQLAIAAGALIGLGVALLTWRLVPAQPDLRDALERLSPEHARRHVSAPVAGEPTQRLGAWGLRVLPPAVWGRTPTAELAILRKPVTTFYGEKVSFALLGLVIPPVLTVLFTIFGADLPLPVPLAGSLVLATIVGGLGTVVTYLMAKVFWRR